MGFAKVALIGGGIFMGLVTFIQCTQTTPVTHWSPKDTISALELAEIFKNNEVAATARFGTNPITITGQFESALINKNGTAVIHLKTDNQYMPIQAGINAYDKMKTANLKKGDKVALACAQVSRPSVYVTALDCWFD